MFVLIYVAVLVSVIFLIVFRKKIFLIDLSVGSPCSNYTVFVGLHSCRFDSLRITARSLDILAKGPPVCGDLAVSLSQAGPQFTQVSLICGRIVSIFFHLC